MFLFRIMLLCIMLTSERWLHHEMWLVLAIFHSSINALTFLYVSSCSIHVPTSYSHSKEFFFIDQSRTIFQSKKSHSSMQKSLSLFNIYFNLEEKTLFLPVGDRHMDIINMAFSNCLHQIQITIIVCFDHHSHLNQIWSSCCHSYFCPNIIYSSNFHK